MRVRRVLRTPRTKLCHERAFSWDLDGQGDVVGIRTIPINLPAKSS